MDKNINWIIKPFDELTIEEVYDFLHLRSKIFVVEQKGIYLDTDYKDQKALHVMGRVGDKLVAYCRLFRAGDYFEDASVGRVVVDSNCRGLEYGHQLMNRALDFLAKLGEDVVHISAQSYLQKFYEGHGFLAVGEEYLEDGIPHIPMKRS